MSVKIFKNFIEKPGGLDVGFQAEKLHGGVLLGVTGQGGVSFFDWNTGGLVRRIEVEPKEVYWSDSGELVTIACEDTYYVLRFSRENYVDAVQSGQVEEDGVEAAFEVITDISESYVPLSIVCVLLTKKCANWRMDWRLLHLHQQHQPTQLPCRRPNLHHLSFRQGPVHFGLHSARLTNLPCRQGC